MQDADAAAPLRGELILGPGRNNVQLLEHQILGRHEHAMQLSKRGGITL
jgi:hypothetical protein